MSMFLCGKKEGKTLCKNESRERNYIFQYIGCKGVCKIENNKNVPLKTACANAFLAMGYTIKLFFLENKL